MDFLGIIFIGLIFWFLTKENKPKEKKLTQQEESDFEDYKLEKYKNSKQRHGLELVNWRKSKKKYLQSIIWSTKRQERMKIDNYRCQICIYHNQIETSELNIHHLTYKRLGYENVDKDLITLCKTHHTAVHDWFGYYTDDEYHEIPYDKIK